MRLHGGQSLDALRFTRDVHGFELEFMVSAYYGAALSPS